MRSPLPFRSSSNHEYTTELNIFRIDEEDADDVFSTLNSPTSREILSSLYDEPHTASGLSNEIGITIQNTKYHIDKLNEANLIEIVDTWYAGNGNEMDVYAPSNKSLVLFANDQSSKSSLLDSIKRFLGAVGVLMVTSAIVNIVMQILRPTVEPQNQAMGTVSQIGEPVGDFFIMYPGLSFFLGGLFILLGIAIRNYWQREIAHRT